jgi:formylglycine-generating enzyme required for sulfatase activity
VLVVLGSCSSGSSKGTSIELRGAVQKGPFVQGAPTRVTLLDSQGQSTGDVLGTHTINELGEFNLSVPANQYLSLEAEGRFFNEVNGETSQTELTLRGLGHVNDGDTQRVFLNVITHLSYDRVRALVDGGTPFHQAIERGESELRQNLGIGRAGLDPGRRGYEMNLLGGDSLANAYLFAVSAVLVQAAADQEGPIEREIQELLDAIAEDLEPDGELDASTRALLAQAQENLDLVEVTNNLQAHLDSLGGDSSLPRLEQVFGSSPGGGGDAGMSDSGVLLDSGGPDGGLVEDGGGSDSGSSDGGSSDGGSSDGGVLDGGLDGGGCSGRDGGVDPSGALEWVCIAGGTFNMGSNSGDFDEQPVHSVTIPPFEMLKTEVTARQYGECVTAGSCTPPGTGAAANWGYPAYQNHPVNYVDWNQMVAFCSWTGGRLPSEAEWEFAARSGGRDFPYPWGDETATCDYAVMNVGGYGCGAGRTWSVCSKLGGNSGQGLCDMAGNVREWVHDSYHENYVGAPADGTAWEDSGPVRVMRGGSFTDTAGYLRAFTRGFSFPTDRASYVGARCVR